MLFCCEFVCSFLDPCALSLLVDGLFTIICTNQYKVNLTEEMKFLSLGNDSKIVAAWTSIKGKLIVFLPALTTQVVLLDSFV